MSTVWYHLNVEFLEVKPRKSKIKWWLSGDGGDQKGND